MTAAEKFELFAEMVSRRAYVIGHPDTFVALRANLPRTMAALDRLVEATRGQYLPNKWCEVGAPYAMPLVPFELRLPKLAEEFNSIAFLERYGAHVRHRVNASILGGI